jgi:hypothetical protein
MAARFLRYDYRFLQRRGEVSLCNISLAFLTVLLGAVEANLCWRIRRLRRRSEGDSVRVKKYTEDVEGSEGSVGKYQVSFNTLAIDRLTLNHTDRLKFVFFYRKLKNSSSSDIY